MPDIEVLSLKHLNISALNEQFAEHKDYLMSLFQDYCANKDTDYFVQRPKDLSTFCLGYHLTGDQQTYMMDLLTTAFGGIENYSAYQNLFWTKIMPEWSLAMFMSLNGSSRLVAIARLTMQEEILIRNSSNLCMVEFSDDSM